MNEIDNFVKENPYNLKGDELDIVSSWKKAIVAEKFILFKYEKEHTLFFGNNNVYGVKGLMDSFRQFFDSHTPIFINLIILPFKNVLVHEGLFVPYNIMIGSRMGSSMKAEAEEAIMKKGITSSLENQEQKKTPSEENMLRFFMKSENNRDRFFEEIDSLREKSPELEAVYNNEIGRINSKQIKSQLKKQGIKGYFAVLFSQVVASGQTKQELSKNILLILPEEKQNQVYTFQIK
ncbi:MAG: hypothetical protein KJ598_02655 [Nanoarchaeota archaeon]|nr:hypothetical protein [Nanoarchaeota archaeon]